MDGTTLLFQGDANVTLHYRGLLASVARLGYQIPEAKKPNSTIIVMIVSELKYATPITSARTLLRCPR